MTTNDLSQREIILQQIQLAVQCKKQEEQERKKKQIQFIFTIRNCIRYIRYASDMA